MTVHLVWVIKYRDHVLRAEVKERCRELIMQICGAEDVRILKGVVSKDHVHIDVEYPASLSVSNIMKRVKGLLEKAFQHLEKRYRDRHFWAAGYGAWSTGNITEGMIQEYLEHHRKASNRESDTFILED